MYLSKILGPSSIIGLLVSEVILAATSYVVVCYLHLSWDPTIFLLHSGGLLRILIVVAAIALGHYLQDLYDDIRVHSRLVLFQQICFGVGLAFFLQAVLNYVDSGLVLPRWVMLGGSALALVALTGWRIFYGQAVSLSHHAERVLFLGDTNLARSISNRLQRRPELSMRGIGFVAEKDGPDGGDGKAEGVLGSLAEFRLIVERERPDRIVVCLAERRNRMPYSDLLDLRFSGIQVEEAATVYETVFQRVCVPELRPSQLIFTGSSGPRPLQILIQSVYSRVIAAVGLVLSLPLVLLTTALVKLTSPGPALFRQSRVGLNGVPFTLYKFRSMYVDAEANSGAVWAKKDDPRITPVGKWLRRFRIDEIPQLINVLKGEMSIVGPRPERQEFVETLKRQIPFYPQRHAVKPGITGWAQINHKYGDSLEDTVTKLEYDLYYIKHLTFSMDVVTMFHTTKVILLGRGAQ